MVLKVLGYGRARNYAGSFGQWSKQADTAVER
jgi:3-mercaptopyruvate sulfurtransferase SseA